MLQSYKQEQNNTWLSLQVNFFIFYYLQRGKGEIFLKKVDIYSHIFVWKAEESHQTSRKPYPEPRLQWSIVKITPTTWKRTAVWIIGNVSSKTSHTKFVKCFREQNMYHCIVISHNLQEEEQNTAHNDLTDNLALG